MSGAQWLPGHAALVVGEDGAMDAVAAALAAHGAMVARAAAVDDQPAAQTVLDTARRQLGRTVSILVHGGGAAKILATQSQSIENWRGALAAGLDSRFAYAASMARGAIADATPVAILFVDKPETSGDAAHAAAIGACGNLTKTLAVEWACDGVRVNAIFSRAAAGQDTAASSALGGMAAYLCSGYGAYITGCIVGIDD